MGWEIKNPPPDELRKFIFVVAPHTSNWDFIVGILFRCIVKKPYKFLAKDSLFKPPHGWLFYRMGGYPVDRSRSTNFVDAVIDTLNNTEELIFAITPEGTRGKVDRWRTGFYYIAHGAGVPLIFARMDWGQKVLSFSDPFYTTGDIDRDLPRIKDFFKGAAGKHPEKGLV
jgi:1-acyl-sn-glycerol-3-phosphate acyltransferase